MKTLGQSVSESIGYAVMKKVFSGLVLVVFGGGGLLLIQLDEKYKLKPAKYAGSAMILFALFAAFIVVPMVVEKMRENEGMSVRTAVAQTFYSYVMFASFLPLVGPHIGKLLESKKTNPFTQDESR